MGVNVSTNTSSFRIPFSFDRNDIPPKVLILGCMGSGKTTLLRQLVQLDKSRPVVYGFYQHSIQNHVLNVWRSFDDVCLLLKVDISAYQEEFQVLNEFRHREQLTERVRNSLLRLAHSDLLNECQKRKRVLPLSTNAIWFMTQTERLINKEYVPLHSELILTYSMTCGIHVEILKLGGEKYEIVELPGHHAFRSRWNQFFKQTSVIVFVVDMSEICDDDFYTGHLKDKTLKIFGDLVGDNALKNSSFIVLFNKMDAFEEQSAGCDFTRLSPHIKTAQDAAVYYRSLFVSSSPQGRTYHHVVSLIKTPNLKATVLDSLHRIFKLNKENVSPT